MILNQIGDKKKFSHLSGLASVDKRGFSDGLAPCGRAPGEGVSGVMCGVRWG